MKFLILGSNSFAASTFINYLLIRNDDVVGISRSPEPDKIFLPYRWNNINGNFRFYQLDINHNLDDIISIIKSYSPDYIADFAGQGMVAESWQSPEQWYISNIVSKVKLHNVIKDFKFLKAYARVSTPEIYGDCIDLIDETASYNPSTPYAVSHAAIDMSLKAFYKQYGFPVLFPRFANFYGPGQQLYRIIPRTIIYALIGKTLYLHGGGMAVRAFIYGDDVADGLFKVMTKGHIGDIYHFSPENFISIRDLVYRICSHLEVNPESLIKNSKDRPGKDNAYLMNSDKVRNELNWTPRYDLDEGIKNTIDWVRQNLDKIKTIPMDYIHKP